jgi:hypothetical protein
MTAELKIGDLVKVITDTGPLMVVSDIENHGDWDCANCIYWNGNRWEVLAIITSCLKVIPKVTDG